MKEIFLLTKILLKSSTNDFKKNGEKKKNTFGRIIFFICIYGYIIGIVSYVSYNVIKSLILVNQPAVFFTLVFIILMWFGIIQTIISGLNILYFSKDLEVLLPMPLTSKKIVLAKLNCLVISQYMISFFMAFPGLMLYGYLLELEVIYYIVAVIALLLFPIIPVAIISVIVTIVMKFTKVIKNKETIQYLTTILTIILIVWIQSFTGNSNITQEELANSLIKTNGMVEVYSNIFVNVKLITNLLLNYNNISGILYLITLILTSFGIYYVAICLISKVYVNTVLSINTVKNQKKSNINQTKDIKTSALWLSYIKKEFKLLIRNPIFFMQCVMPSIIFPIIIALPAGYGVQDSGVDLKQFTQDFSNIINTSFGMMCCLVAIIFMYVFNYTSITAVSRDGQNAVFMKYIPVSLKNQIIYKALPGILLNIIPTIYISALGLLFFKGIELNTAIYIFTITLLINILNNILSVLVDLKYPKLKWITEYAVVKQNSNMIFEFIIIAIEIAIIVWLGNFIKDINDFSTILVLILGLTLMVIKKYILKKEMEIFDKII